MSDFSQWSLRPELVEAIASQGITEPTPIQLASLADILTGTDVLAQAKTGSGKTLACALGILSGLGRWLGPSPSPEPANRYLFT